MNIIEPLIVQRIPHILKNTINKFVDEYIFCLFTSQITRWEFFVIVGFGLKTIK